MKVSNQQIGQMFDISSCPSWDQGKGKLPRGCLLWESGAIICTRKSENTRRSSLNVHGSIIATTTGNTPFFEHKYAKR